ncbi:uncharacterized protein G2W53_010282 [Senna tora]|uniref:Uncharacterized protein n=1 Tax=Senna tora TaxID=362788 RepID=A0A834X0S0_9FABA|nr:uncharacterized protein G2W53_010282 [Senna tora]
MTWEGLGSCINIFRKTNRGRTSETFTNSEAKHLLRKSVNPVLTYSGRQIASGFDATIGVVMAWEERGSCLKIFQMTDRGRISEIFTTYEAKHLLRKSVDHVLTYSGREIAVRSLKPSRITRQNTCCANDKSPLDLRNLQELRGKRLVAQVSETRRFTFFLRTGMDLMLQLESSWHGRSVDHVLTYSGREIASGFDVPIGVVMAWEERGSGLNIFRTTNHVRISETFKNYEAKDLSGFDAPIGFVMAWEERGPCLNIFRMTNRVRISETFMNYEAKHLLRKRSVDHVLTYSGRQIAVGSHKPSGIMRQKTCCANEKSQPDLINLHELRGKRLVLKVSETRQFALYLRTGVVSMLQLESSSHGRSVDHVLTYSGRQIASGFDAPIGVVMAWEERGSCLNIFQMRNRCRVSETFANYDAKYLLRKSVDHVLTYSERQIAVESQKPSGITRQKTCCPIVMAWEERGSRINIFQMKNYGRISETFTNYDAKDFLRKRSVDHVLTYSGIEITVESLKPSRITRQNTCCANDKSRSDLRNLHELRFKTLVAQVSETRWFALYLRTRVDFMVQSESSWHGRSVDHVLTYFEQEIATGSQKPSRITRQKTCCARE